MTGIIVTGHGHFPTGMLSAVELVAGVQDNMAGVDFESGQSTQDLKEHMTKAVDSLEGDEILILADLVGGSPFNVAAAIRAERTDKHIRVLAGTNMAAMIEATFSRAAVPFEALSQAVKKAAAEGIVDMEDLECGDGEEEFSDGL